jgi:hypothetical protein
MIFGLLVTQKLINVFRHRGLGFNLRVFRMGFMVGIMALEQAVPAIYRAIDAPD